DLSDLSYDFNALHLGLIAAGPDATDAIKGLTAALGHRHLLVHPDDETIWAWVGDKHKVDTSRLERLVSSHWPPQVALAIGKQGRGLHGWRLTHRQAKAALPIALRMSRRIVRYADVTLLASMLQDDLLATSLSEQYLIPIQRQRDGGKAARKTL